MIQITVEGRRASVSNKELLTSGSAGIEAQFTLDEAWELAPARTAVFRVGDDGDKYDVPLDNSLTCVVPPECLTVSDEVLFIGIYGGNGSGTIIIPTIWVSAGVIRPGTEPNTPREYQPTPSVVEQIHEIANRAEQTATDAMTLVEEGLQDLSTLESTVQANEEQRQQNETRREADFNTMMQSARAYLLEPSVSAIVYDPNAESGAQISPTDLEVSAYYIDNEGDRGGFSAPFFEVSFIPETGEPVTTSLTNTSVAVVTIPQTITPSTTVQARIWKNNSLGLPMTLAEITIPVVANGEHSTTYILQPDYNIVEYDPNAEAGSRFSPSSFKVYAYKVTGHGERERTTALTLSYFVGDRGGIAFPGSSEITVNMNEQRDTPDQHIIVYGRTDGNLVVAQIEIPIVSNGLKGDPFTYADFTEEQKEELVQGPILDAQTSAVAAVNQAGTDQVAAVNSAGATQTAAAAEQARLAGESATNASNSAAAATTAKNDAVTAKDAAVAAQEAAETAETNAEAAQTAAEEAAGSVSASAAQIAQNTSDISDLTRQLNDETTGLDTKAPVILETASGAIASFDDGADGMPVKKLVAQIEPVQDLHGYDHPWPGGAGKNKLNITAATTTSNGVTFTVNSDGTISTSGTASDTAVFRQYLTAADLPSGSSLILNGCPAGGDYNNGYSVLLVSSDGSPIGEIDTGSGATYSEAQLANLGQFQIVIRTGVNANNLVFKTMIRLATEADSTFAPYSNECPISGWTGAEIEQRGKNLLPDDYSVYDSISGGNYLVLNDVVPPGELARFTFIDKDTSVVIPSDVSFGFIAEDLVQGLSPINFNWAIYRGQPNNERRMLNNGAGISSGIYARNVFMYPKTKETFDTIFSRYYVMVELGDIKTDFESYTGDQISVNWEDEAGTVYGGEDEVISGKLKSTMGIVDLGTLYWSADSNRPGVFYTSISTLASRTDALCSSYEFKNTSVSTLYDKYISTWNSYGRGVFIRDTDYASKTESEFKTAMSGVQLCYELAEPVEYDLTPQSMTTLYGTNNIWSSTGDTEVTYPADIKLYVDNAITQAIANALNS